SFTKKDVKAILLFQTGCFPLVSLRGNGNLVCLSSFCQRSGELPNNSLATTSANKASRCIASFGNTIGVFKYIKIRKEWFAIERYAWLLLLTVSMIIYRFSYVYGIHFLYYFLSHGLVYQVQKLNLLGIQLFLCP